MKICKHENADHLMPGDPYVPYRDASVNYTFRATYEQLRCLRCGALLSLGPSNDEPAEVQIEIEAARWAATPVSVHFPAEVQCG